MCYLLVTNCIDPVFVLHIQIDSAESDDKLRFLFDDKNECGADNESLLLETGFRKPLCLLVTDDKPNMKKAISDNHSLVKIKPELDQFLDGLKTLGVLEKIRYPSLMSPLFTDQGKKELSKGKQLHALYVRYTVVVLAICSSCIIRVLQVPFQCFVY